MVDTFFGLIHKNINATKITPPYDIRLFLMTVVYVSVIIQSVSTIADFINVCCWAKVFSA